MKSSLQDSASLDNDEIKKHLTCGVCTGLLASSLVLGCGHSFCGTCLFDLLNDKPSCPTCAVSFSPMLLRFVAPGPFAPHTSHIYAARYFDVPVWYLVPAYAPIRSIPSRRSVSGLFLSAVWPWTMLQMPTGSSFLGTTSRPTNPESRRASQ